MFKNIYINLINAASKPDEIFYERTFHVIYDDDFSSELDITRSVCEALSFVCYDIATHNFHSAVVTDAETGEILAELKRVDEEM